MLLTKRKSSNLSPLSSRWSLHTSDHVIPCPRVARSSRFVASACADSGDSVPLDCGGRSPAFQSRRRSLRCWPLPQLRWECYEISWRDVGSGRRWGRSAAALQCGDDGSHGSVAVQVEEITSSVVGSAWGVVVGEMALVRAFAILFFWWIQAFSVTRDHGSSALNRDPGLGFWKSSGGDYGGDGGESHWKCLRPC